MAGAQERTEKATPKRRREARRKGEIGNSPEVGSWLGLLAASIVLPSVGTSTMSAAQDLLAQVRPVAASSDIATGMALLRSIPFTLARAVLPLAGLMMAVSMVSVVSQGGFTVAPKLLMPKFSRLNPLQGMKRLVGAQGWWSLAKALVKTAVLGGVAWAAVHHLVTSLPASGALTLASVLQVGTSTALTLVRWTAVAGVLLSAGDYAMVRRRNNKALKMTKHEVKEEMRQAEGDPHIKSTRRSRAIALTRQRMFAAIQAADVVVVNPTHVAVALKYEANKGAPRVVAKGADAVAARIRATAEQHRVPMVEDVPLARALYKACDVGQEIPVELFQAVASVLAFLFRLRKRGSVAGMHRLA